MKKERIEYLERCLNERWLIALETDKNYKKSDENKMAPNNPDFIFYKGMIESILILGFDYIRHDNGTHKVIR